MADSNVKYRISQTGAEKVSGSFKKIAGAMTAAFGGFAILNEVRKAGVAFLDLDKGMRLVNTITKVTGEELKTLTSQVVDLSNELGTPTSQMTGAIYQAVSAGVAFNDIMKFMKVATKGAIAGNADVETSVDALTTIMNSFGFTMEEVTDVTDIMFKTIELGKTELKFLAASYSLVTPLAAASGVSFKDLSIALGVLTAAGTPTSQAMTQLSAIIVALKKKLGETTFENRSFFEALEEGRIEYKKSGKTLTEFLGRKEAELALLGLTGDKANSVTIATKKMEERTGSAAKAFEEMERSISKAIQNITTLIENKLIVAIDSMLSSVLAVVKLISESPELQALLKLGATPIFVGSNAQPTPGTNFNEENIKLIRVHFKIINEFGKGLVVDSKEYNATLERVFGNVRRIGDGYIKIVERTKDTKSEVKKILGFVGITKQKIEDLKKDIDAWTGSLIIFNQMQLELLGLEKQLEIPMAAQLTALELITLERIKSLSIQELITAEANSQLGITLAQINAFDRRERADEPTSFITGNELPVGLVPIITKPALKETKKDMKVVGDTIFAGWAGVLTSNMNTAWTEIFGEANSLFEQMVNSMVDLLTKQLFSELFKGALSFLPGGSLLSGIGSLFGGVIGGGLTPGGGGQPQIIQIQIGGRTIGQAVLAGNRQIRELRLTE